MYTVKRLVWDKWVFGSRWNEKCRYSGNTLTWFTDNLCWMSHAGELTMDVIKSRRQIQQARSAIQILHWQVDIKLFAWWHLYHHLPLVELRIHTMLRFLCNEESAFCHISNVPFPWQQSFVAMPTCVPSSIHANHIHWIQGDEILY